MEDKEEEYLKKQKAMGDDKEKVLKVYQLYYEIFARLEEVNRRFLSGISKEDGFVFSNGDFQKCKNLTRVYKEKIARINREATVVFYSLSKGNELSKEEIEKFVDDDFKDGDW